MKKCINNSTIDVNTSFIENDLNKLNEFKNVILLFQSEMKMNYNSLNDLMLHTYNKKVFEINDKKIYLNAFYNIRDVFNDIIYDVTMNTVKVLKSEMTDGKYLLDSMKDIIIEINSMTWFISELIKNISN